MGRQTCKAKGMKQRKTKVKATANGSQAVTRKRASRSVKVTERSSPVTRQRSRASSDAETVQQSGPDTSAANSDVEMQEDEQVPSADEATVALKSNTVDLKDEDLYEATQALKKKLDRDRNGKRQYGRRKINETTKLSSFQKNLYATTYRTAVLGKKPVPYQQIANSPHFVKWFKGDPEAVKAVEQDLVLEMKIALEEQRRLDTGTREKSIDDWREENVRYESLHKQDQVEIHNLGERLAKCDAVSKNLQALVKTVKDENVRLKEEMKMLKDENIRLEQEKQRQTQVPESEKDLGLTKMKLDKQAEDQERMKKELDEQHAALESESTKIEKIFAKKNEERQRMEKELEKQRAALESEKTRLEKLSTEQNEENQRMAAQMAKSQRNEAHAQRLLEEEREKHEADKLVWQKGRETIPIEVARLTHALEQQLQSNGYAGASNRLIQERKRTVEECASNEGIVRELHDAIRNARRECVEAKSQVTGLEFLLNSYRLCGITERQLEKFANTNAIPSRDGPVNSQSLQRRFVSKIYNLRNPQKDAQKAFLDVLHGFSHGRNSLCHDEDGNNVEAVDHVALQRCCNSILATIKTLEPWYREYASSQRRDRSR